MTHLILTLAKKFRPGLQNLSEQRQLAGAGDVIVFLALAPASLAGLLWLVFRSDPAIARQNWPAFLLFGVLILLFDKVNYFIIVEIRNDRYGSADGSFSNMVQWAALLLFGPTALWLSILWSWLDFAWLFQRTNTQSGRWSQLRGFVLDQSTNTLGPLAGLVVYERLGGQYPIAGLSPGTVMISLAGLAAQLIVVMLVLSAYVAYAIWIQSQLKQPASLDLMARFILMAVGLPFMAYPFGILGAGLWVQNGMAVFIFFMLGLLMVAYMARQLSWAVESSRRQSRQLQKLEHFGRDVLNSPPDASRLANLLEEHVPTMFPPGRVAIWLLPDQALFKNPPDWDLPIQAVSGWVLDRREARAFLKQDELPWNSPERLPGDHEPVVVAPILDVEKTQPMGVIYLQLRTLVQPWDRPNLLSLFPAAQSLAAQIASVLHQADVYAETLEYEQAAQELVFAGRIQASFLPSELPSLDGWELAVTLLPARETSGDFFDFIPLEDGKIGILIADVADKGMGAALYMALSRTLIRTYALEYGPRPDIVMMAANERILQDARANLFITAFYGVLDGASGTLTYCNAGHTTPYLFRAGNDLSVQALATTGMPVGIEADAVWRQDTVQIEPGDTLLLYTDGIPDALNSEGEFFREVQLVEVVRENQGLPAQEIQSCILDAVQEFANGVPQFDDITLLVLLRNEG